MSMYTAMNELGLKCHHMKELFGNPQQVPLWTKAHTEGLSPAEWDEVSLGALPCRDSKVAVLPSYQLRVPCLL